ncbi:MAG TPA: hypothetical protein ENJ19_10060 [Gammaproteobacteria bacterium]|nr:hypothetical protein [Gammaproteobacteria bacterium]
MGFPVCFALLFLATAAEGAAYDIELDGNLGLAYRRDNLTWNIAGTSTGTNPNILSELAWNQLHIAELQGELWARLKQRFISRLYGATGEILAGDNQDSDYSSDNRQGEFSRSNNAAGGRVLDASAGVGYEFRLFDRTVERYAYFAPMIGYSLHRQNLTMFDGVQTVDPGGTVPRAIDGLDSRYDARWRGGWAGFRFRMEASKRRQMTLRFEYHFKARYRGEADWNLRSDLAHPVSFVHEARGEGFAFEFRDEFQLSRRWGGVFRFSWQAWTTDPGVDTVFTVDETTGQPSGTQTTRLNNVNWRSYSFGLQARYRY